MRPTKTYDKERISVNLARLKKGGEVFEVIIDPEKIIEYKTKKNIPVKDVLMYEKIFSDAKKGFEASHEHMKAVFDTNTYLEIAEHILNNGEIQFTQEYREKKRTEKKNKILDIITRNAIDPKTGIPHPRNRIEAAIEEANVKFDYYKSAEDQVRDIVSELKPILPIKLAVKELRLKIPAEYGAKAYSLVERYADILEDNWLSDGSWSCRVSIPAGIQNEFFDELNKLTHGNMESKTLSER